MKESAEEKARQEKLTRYLLGETEDEERLEIEKMHDLQIHYVSMSSVLVQKKHRQLNQKR